MPPSDTSPQGVVRYLTKLLTALTIEAGGELRIPLKAIRGVELEAARQILVEDTDSKHDQLVLRFASRHAAIFPLEPECLTPAQNRPSQQVATSVGTASAPQPSIRKPPSEADLLKLEKNIKARRVEAQLRREHEQQQKDLSEILGSNSTS
jgi:hypothetical protein